MRSVFVFPRLEQADIVAILDALSPRQNEPWLVDDVLQAELDSEDDGLLYQDWEPAAIEQLTATIGHRPAWAIQIDVSGRVDGTEQVRRLVLTLLDAGGVAMDDYSDRAWTAHDIRSGARYGGLSFFDFRGFRRAQGDRGQHRAAEADPAAAQRSGPSKVERRA